MGFPRKDDFARIYRDKDGSYFVIFSAERDYQGCYDAIANVYPGPRPSLVGTSIHPNYIAGRWLKRIQFDELPAEWQDAIREYLGRGPCDDPEIPPESIRGFWRVGEQPKRQEQAR